MSRQTRWRGPVGAHVPQVTRVGSMAGATRACGSSSTGRHGCWRLTRRCIMRAPGWPITCSPTGIPACLQASSRPSSAASSCAKRDRERNVMRCSQTWKTATLTHPSLWADHSLYRVLESVARAEGQKGFAVLPHRWVVESTLAWLNQCRRWRKDDEELPTTSETFVYVAMTRLMLKRLAA